MIKELRITFDEDEWDYLVKTKGTKSWRDFILSSINYKPKEVKE